jgi:antitoxin CptB
MTELKILKKKLLYRSSYRGTKEMDILLSSFVKEYIDKLNSTDLNDLNMLLDLEDEDIYNFYQNDILKKNIKLNNVLNLLKNFKL